MNMIAVFDPNSSFNKAKISGTVKFHQCNRNSKCFVEFDLQGFEPYKVQGIHIHRCGDLTKGCSSACEHYNPFGRMHGNLNRNERHVGDLINNIVADSGGKFKFSYEDDLIELYGDRSIAGRMIVIHADKDDGGNNIDNFSVNEKVRKESGITGNAGARIACSIIGVAESSNCS